MDDGLQDDGVRAEAVVPGRGSCVALVVLADTADTSTSRRALEGCSLSLHFVPSLAEALSVIPSLRPDVIFVDGALAEHGCEGLDREALALVFAASATALRVLLLPDTTGPWIQLAHRCDADVVVPSPLEPAAVMRIVAGRRQRPAVGPVASGRPDPVVLPELVDRSERMRDVWRHVALASRSDAAVVICGETGVGKEVVARALHRFSPRRHAPFVAINCAALPETLLESELFGHEKGAFTGAMGQRKGRFELADGGTLFLDEVGDLPLALQVKLLRVLQEQRFERLGGARTISVDVRIISATHRALEREVSRGRFRADLYYRIRVLSIAIAPLRERKEDILPLWDRFLLEGAQREGRAPPATTVAARRRLLRHRWPGNVRELYNAAQHALLVAGTRAILPADLPELSDERDHLGHLDHLDHLGGESPVGMTLHQIERAAILETHAAMGTVKATAEVLGISERKLHYRLKHYREDDSVASQLHRAALPRRRGATSDDHGPSTPRILLAEDDDELRWGLHDFLRCAGYRVIAVEDGRSLLERIGAAVLFESDDEPPDAIITDVRMPFLTGLQLLQNVRDRGWSTPVVVISAFADAELQRRADHLGAAAVLTKPIDTDALLRVLRGVVSQ